MPETVSAYSVALSYVIEHCFIDYFWFVTFSIFMVCWDCDIFFNDNILSILFYSSNHGDNKLFLF